MLLSILNFTYLFAIDVSLLERKLIALIIIGMKTSTSFVTDRKNSSLLKVGISFLWLIGDKYVVG